ncbi:MAG: biotin/lipoyl-containing protein [Desulfopila sp.]|jgi:biotin carboxyl carrier protein|nr:biotin/lipoyl-containing protein [Desulfopila sp.]
MRNFRVVVNGNEYKVAIEEIAGADNSPVRHTEPTRPVANKEVVQAPAPAQQTSASSKSQLNGSVSGRVTAAMPGTILDVKVAVGDTVTMGQPLLILEAMKMENDVMAPCDGVVEEIHVVKGASVNSGDLLLVLS